MKKLRKEQELKALRQEYMSKCDEFKCLRSVPKPIAGEDFSGYAQAQARLEYLDYWFSVNHWR